MRNQRTATRSEHRQDAWLAISTVAWSSRSASRRDRANAAYRRSGCGEAVGAGERSVSGRATQDVIGPQDVLGINFWRDADMTGDVTVRPDGRITLPLLGDLLAAGMTPEALGAAIHAAASN